uniref:Granulins domain-containing protein n=1 Tax=Astyanax mexicanus TaxID=7994 RepID=A0A8B9HAX4_ASTMX
MDRLVPEGEKTKQKKKIGVFYAMKQWIDLIHQLTPTHTCKPSSWRRFQILVKKHSDSEESTPAVPVQQVLDTIEMDDEIVHCDSSYGCPSDSTCCKRLNEGWGYCPYTEGKCCADGIHCCAYGYSCDPTSTRCVVGDLSLPSFPQRPAVTIPWFPSAPQI